MSLSPIITDRCRQAHCRSISDTVRRLAFRSAGNFAAHVPWPCTPHSGRESEQSAVSSAEPPCDQRAAEPRNACYCGYPLQPALVSFTQRQVWHEGMRKGSVVRTPTQGDYVRPPASTPPEWEEKRATERDESETTQDDESSDGMAQADHAAEARLVTPNRDGRQQRQQVEVERR